MITVIKQQVRSQSALHNFPLLGDTAYGAQKNNNNREYYLQASKLIIPENPVGVPSEIAIPLSDDFIDILKYCGISQSRV